MAHLWTTSAAGEGNDRSDERDQREQSEERHHWVVERAHEPNIVAVKVSGLLPQDVLLNVLTRQHAHVAIDSVEIAVGQESSQD